MNRRFPLRARSAVLASFFLFLTLLAGAAGAKAELLLTHLRGEARAVKVAQANGGAIRFAAEARLANAGGWSLGARRLPGDPPTSTAPFDWPNGTPIPFVLAYDGRRTVSLTLFQGDRRSAVTYQSDKLGDCDELFLSAVAAGPDNGASLAGLKLGDLPVKNAPAAGNPSGEQDVLRIQGGNLTHGFTLTGAITLSWGSARPSGSDLHVLFWGARMPAAPAGQRPSRVTITAPAPESVLASGTPTITAVFPEGKAVDPATVLLMVDGADRTPQAEIGAAGLTFTPPARLLEGKHTAQVIVRAPGGREEQASVSFTTDTVPPSIAFASPPRIVTGTAAPIIRLTYSDLTSGLDTGTLKVALDGESIDSICVANAASGVCIPQAIEEGSHLLTATIRDRAGNAGTASFAFTLSLNEESE
ncbi:MAG TPA: choice-of-anchor W domain-containing protein [Thermoanaerobaculia bacterium]